MGKPKNSQWFDHTKAKPAPVKISYPNGCKQVVKRPGLPDMVFVGINAKGQKVSIDKAQHDRLTKEHGQKAKEIILS